MKRNSPVHVIVEDGVEVLVNSAGERLVLNAPIPYTLGPAAGDYDIEWPDVQDGTPSDPAPMVKLRGNEVTFSGKVVLSDTNGAYTLTMAFPPELRPNGKRVIGGFVFYDDNPGTSSPGRFEIETTGLAVIKKLEEFAWVADEELWLSGSYFIDE